MVDLISISIGAFVGLSLWLVWSVFNAIPEENRSFLDRPAMGFRMAWPLIQALVHYADWLFTTSGREVTRMRLKRAGVEYSLTAEQFLAARYVSAAVVGVITLVVTALMGWSPWMPLLILTVLGFFYPDIWLKEATTHRQASIVRTLPFYLDVITLSVEAGSNLTGGLTQAIQKTSESPLRAELSRVLRDIRAGRSRAEALQDMSDRTGSPSVQSVVNSMIQAEKTGSSLGPILRAQAEQLRTERFQRAEKLAMEAPVKLLLPLISCIFPTTFFVLTFLVLSKGIREGAFSWPPLLWIYNWPG